MRMIAGRGCEEEGESRYESASRPFQTAVTGKPSLRMFLMAMVWLIALAALVRG